MRNVDSQSNPQGGFTMSGIPQYVEIRFSDNARYRISVAFIFAHYIKFTKDNPKKTKDQFISNPQEVLNYAIQNISWGVMSMSAIGVLPDRMPDYNAELKDPANSKIVYEVEKKKLPRLLETYHTSSEAKPLGDTIKIDTLTGVNPDLLGKSENKTATEIMLKEKLEIPRSMATERMKEHLPTTELPKATIKGIKGIKITPKIKSLKGKKRK
jgi:hypothetical protein